MSAERDRLFAEAKQRRKKAQSYAESAERMRLEGTSPGYFKRYCEFAAREVARAKDCERRAWRIRP